MEEQVQQSEERYDKGRLIKLIVAFFVIAVLAVCGLVFKDQIGLLFAPADEESGTLTIAYAEGFTSIDPANYEVRNMQYLGNVFEGLTRFDKNLELEPALAISWGQVLDDVWEFKLREGVYFHDGSTLGSSDVVTSIEYALNSEDSQVKSLLGTIVEVRATSDFVVEITTDGMDPILPNRLAHVYIFPVEASGYENFLVGTGPYYAVSYVDGSEFNLKKFDYYWGGQAQYDEVKLIAIPDKDERENAILNGEVDVLVNVAPESVSALQDGGVKVVSQTGLETGFLLFNEEFFFEEALREAFLQAVDRDVFVEGLGGYAKKADQFVSSGVNGYDSGIDVPSYDPVSAKMIFEDYDMEKSEVYMTYDMVALGSFLEEEFLKIDIDVDSVYLTSEEIANGIGDFPVYFMGWKSDLGDAADLFEAIFASDGDYNPGYSNDEVDELIAEASDEEDEIVRISILKDIMGILIDDIAGVPLFEAKTIYGFKDGIEWSPRVDGMIWAVEVGR